MVNVLYTVVLLNIVHSLQIKSLILKCIEYMRQKPIKVNWCLYSRCHTDAPFPRWNTIICLVCLLGVPLHSDALQNFVVMLIFSFISISFLLLDGLGRRLCLSDLIEQILWLSSLRQNDGSVIAYQGSHGPALSEWALLMAFSTEESISGPPSDDNNTGISSALCALNYLDFFPTSFKSTPRLWHEREEL